MTLTTEEKQYYYNLEQRDIYYCFINECEKGNIHCVSYLLTDEKMKEKFNLDINYNKSQALIKSCEYGNLELVKYLLTSTELEKHADVSLVNKRILNLICEKGHLELVRFLLTHPQLKHHFHINSNKGSQNYPVLKSHTTIYDYPFIEACKSNNLKLVKYLLTSPELEEHAHINCEDSDGLTGFIFACYNGNKDLVEYMLYSSDLKEHANINAYDKKFKLNGFSGACVMGKTEIIDYLYSVEKEQLIKNFHIERAFSRCIEQMLQSSRELMERIIPYLISNTHLTLTKEIQKDLDNTLRNNSTDYQMIIGLFNKKQLKEKLENFLYKEQVNKTKRKI